MAGTSGHAESLVSPRRTFARTVRQIGPGAAYILLFWFEAVAGWFKREILFGAIRRPLSISNLERLGQPLEIPPLTTNYHAQSDVAILGVEAIYDSQVQALVDRSCHKE